MILDIGDGSVQEMRGEHGGGGHGSGGHGSGGHGGHSATNLRHKTYHTFYRGGHVIIVPSSGYI